MQQIRVPATTANLGPGFDSLGLALQLYLTVTIGEETVDWQVNHPFGPNVPSDRQNLIVATALDVAADLTPHHLTVTSDIPFARGLGSSSAALAAGIALGNLLGDLHLSKLEMVTIGTRLEGHPDNIAPAILGGAVAAFADGDQTFAQSVATPELSASVFIPNRELLTAEARRALPETLAFKTAVAASATANTLLAALVNGDLATIGQLLEADQFHEAARAHLVPELKTIRDLAHAQAIFGTYLSGAGPTILTLTTADSAKQLADLVAQTPLDGQSLVLPIDHQGVTISEI
jgi:homoserine kinase